MREKDLTPIIGNAIQFLFQFPDSIFQKQVSTTPRSLYLNSMFVQKKGEIGAFYKQGSGLAHSLVQENPEKDNSEVSCSLDCAKYPPPLQSKTEPLAPLSCRSARSMGESPGAEGSPVLMFWLPVPPSLPQHLPGPNPPPWEPLLWMGITRESPFWWLGSMMLNKTAANVDQGFSLSGSLPETLPSGFSSMQDEVAHPPAQELGWTKVVSDLQTLSSYWTTLSPGQQLMPPDQCAQGQQKVFSDYTVVTLSPHLSEIQVVFSEPCIRCLILLLWHK